MDTLFGKLCAGILCCIGGGALVYWVDKKTLPSKIAKHIDVDIPAEDVHKAINIACEREARKAAVSQYSLIEEKVKATLAGDLEKAKENIANSVARDLHEKRIQISGKDIRDRVVKLAYDDVKDQLSDVVDDLTEQVKDRLQFFPFGTMKWK